MKATSIALLFACLLSLGCDTGSPRPVGTPIITPAPQQSGYRCPSCNGWGMRYSNFWEMWLPCSYCDGTGKIKQLPKD